MVLSMLMVPLMLASGSASWYLLKKEQEEQGLEAPCIANSWAWDKPLGTTASYTPLGGKKKDKEKKKRRKDKDGSEKRSKKRDKTKDGEEGAKRRRSKKPPPLSKADPKTEEAVID
jgi:hypothetical protein|eukprot:COSAG02_NODE_35_length_49339_cov_20.375102_35_plen_116_part_00